MDPPDGRGGQDVQDVFPDEGGTAAMSSGGVPGGSSNNDVNVGALRAPARPRHRGYAGGGQHPPPTVSPVQHAVPQMAPIERLPGDLHVTPGTPWVGEVALLQHHHSVLDVPLQKVQQYCRTCC